MALARYCDRLLVESGADREFETEVHVAETPVSIDLDEVLGQVLLIVQDYFHIQRASVMLVDPRSGDLYCRVQLVHGKQTKAEEKILKDLGEHLGFSSAEARPIIEHAKERADKAAGV